MIISETNLSVAWGKAFLQVFRQNEIAPLVVVIEGLENAEQPEIPVIRESLDSALKSDANGLTCNEVANTIFPASLWNSSEDRSLLYKRYFRIQSKIRKYSANRYGVYFQRLIAFGCDRDLPEEKNQLEHIIQTWNGGNHRRSALQASIVDPFKDHTDQRQRGFPCLQQVAFAPVENNGLSVTGFYAIQHMFARAYGNYLGLTRLGAFMAHEMGLTLSKVICIATPATRDGKVGQLERLAAIVDRAINDYENGSL